MVNIIKKSTKITNHKTKAMKKLILLAAFFSSFCISAQDLYIQNYTDTVIQFVVWRLNPSNLAGNCSPNLQSTSSGGLSTLTYAPVANTVPSEAYYYGDINTSNTFNPSYPSTPLIDAWTYDNNYSTPYTLPSNPVPTAYITGSQWGGIKLGVQDHFGNNIGGYYSLGHFCGSTTPITAFSGVIQGSYFQFGGADWYVLY